jgi:hypothetical protein
MHVFSTLVFVKHDSSLLVMYDKYIILSQALRHPWLSAAQTTTVLQNLLDG